MIRYGIGLAFTVAFALGLGSEARAQAAPNQPVDPRTRAELVAVREAVWRAFFQGDSAALARLLPEHMTAMEHDRAEIIHEARRFAKGGGQYVGMDFTENQFYVNGNVAIVWSHYVVHTTDSTGAPNARAGRAIELFVKQHGHWINPHWHLDAEK